MEVVGNDDKEHRWLDSSSGTRHHSRVGLAAKDYKTRGIVMKATEFLSGLIIAVAFLVLSASSIPTTYWYKYLSIKPTKEVYTVGEPLKFISTVENYTSGDYSIEWHDELRCVVKNEDTLIGKVTSTGSLFYNNRLPNKTVWSWGSVPKNTPLDVPCYIRSIQTIEVLFGINRKTTYESSFFKISEFDYTRQQQKG